MRKRLPKDREGTRLHFTIFVTEHGKQGEPAPTREVDGYLTLNLHEDGSLGEIFVSVGKAGDAQAAIGEWAKSISKLLQVGVSVEDTFGSHLNTRFGDHGLVRGVPCVKRCSSLYDLVAQIAIARFGKKDAA